MAGECNVADFLLEGKDPGRLVLRLLDRDHTYGELQRATTQVARYLSTVGGHTGDRALLIADNSMFWVAAYLGTMRAGLVSVPLPPGIPSSELDYISRTTAARIAFVQTEVAVRNANCFASMHVLTNTPAAGLPAGAGQRSFSELGDLTAGTIETPRASAADLAALMFTSGSTDRPRGVMISHGNIVANTESIIAYLGLTENDRIMAVLPFYYCFGTSLLHTHLKVGGSLVVDPRFMYPEVILERMIETECTGFAGVPSHFQILLRSSSIRRKSFPHLRYVQQAGGGLAKAFIQELRQVLPWAQVFVMYGQTEATARLSYLPPACLETKLGSIGRGIPGVLLRVLNERGQQVRAGEVGEIVAEGRNVASGYWCAPEESAVSFRDGQLYTGDLATVDEDGFIYIVDRAKDFIKCGGARISCRYLTDQLLGCDSLMEAAVIGVPDVTLGEAVKAFVVPRDPQTRGLEEQVRLFCKKHMPPQLVPREIVVLRELPRNSAGKVVKPRLRDL